MTKQREIEKDRRHTSKIRSFVRRQGRLTAGQQTALSKYWPSYGIEFEQQQLDFLQLFGKANPVIIEIGFGNGDTLADMAKAETDHHFIGIEVHRPGVGHLLYRLQSEQINNVRIICADAIEVLKYGIADASISGVRLYFPDPWPKRRHHKRRIVQTDFVNLLADKLKPGGIFHMATDWQDYADHMQKVMSPSKQFTSLNTIDGYSNRPDWRPKTKFEDRGLNLGHDIRDLIYQRKQQ